jgi:hypothetical protein
MTTDGGGWTLIASYVDGSFFNDCTDVGMSYGTSCYTICTEFTDDGLACDTQEEKDIQDSELAKLKSKMLIDSSFGSLANYQTDDFISPAYYMVPFDESMFSNDQNEFITYDFADYGSTISMTNFYETTDTTHLVTRIPEKETNLPSSINGCDTLELAIMIADTDGGAPEYADGNKYGRWAPARTGPGWDANNNGGCHYDDLSWRISTNPNVYTGSLLSNKRLGGQNNEISSYILWFVR